MQDEYDYIDRWLYEAPDADYTVWWEEDGKEVSVDLTEADALYDYLAQHIAESDNSDIGVKEHADV